MPPALKPWLSTCRHNLAAMASKVYGLLGRRILNREQTVATLRSKNAPSTAGFAASLDGDCEILRWGVVRIGRQCLDLDYGARSAILGWRGSVLEQDHVAAVWSHPWMGYYHWIIDVAPKIALFQEIYGKPLGNLKICYPSSGQPFEKETLDLLEVSQSSVIDTRGHKAVRARRLDYVMLPGWYEIQPAAKLLRERLIKEVSPTSDNKIYVARAGRRRCVNEDEVRDLLEKRGYVYVEDRPRTVREQIALFSQASVIVAPNGAALTNILWCSPDCVIIELFGPNYLPPYYQNLSKNIGLKYHGIRPSVPGREHWAHVDSDYTCDMRVLVNTLDELNL